MPILCNDGSSVKTADGRRVTSTRLSAVLGQLLPTILLLTIVTSIFKWYKKERLLEFQGPTTQQGTPKRPASNNQQNESTENEQVLFLWYRWGGGRWTMTLPKDDGRKYWPLTMTYRFHMPYIRMQEQLMYYINNERFIDASSCTLSS